MKQFKSIIIISIAACWVGLWLTACDMSNESTALPGLSMDELISQRNSFVSSEIAKVNATSVGWDKNNFRANQEATFDNLKQQYLNALNSAAALLSNPAQMTYRGIVRVDSMLSPPGRAFNTNILLFDHRALNDVIVEAEALYNNTPVGSGSGQVPQAASTAFNTAITAAKTVRNTITSTDLVAQNAINTLVAAKQTFTNAIIP